MAEFSDDPAPASQLFCELGGKVGEIEQRFQDRDVREKQIILRRHFCQALENVRGEFQNLILSASHEAEPSPASVHELMPRWVVREFRSRLQKMTQMVFRQAMLLQVRSEPL